MRIQDFRSSFFVYLLDGTPKRSEYARDLVSKVGYRCEMFSEWSALKTELQTRPPHILLIHLIEKRWKVEEVIRETLLISPETHVILLSTPAQMGHASAHFESGVYDIVPFPFEAQAQLLRALDRAAELDFHVYKNEQNLNPKKQQDESRKQRPDPPYEVDLDQSMISTDGLLADSKRSRGPDENSQAAISFNENSQVSEIIKVSQKGPLLSSFSIWLEELYRHKSIEESTEHFAKGVYTYLSKTPSVYFKYFAPRRALVASFGVGLEPLEVRGLGINLNEVEENFRVQDLRKPEKIKALQDMMKEIFQRSEYICQPLEIQGRIVGLFIFFPDPQLKDLVDQVWFTSAFQALGKNLLLIETQRRLHSTGGHDEATEICNRQGFLQTLTEEIARARRTQLPISLLLIRVDQLTEISDSFGREEADLILRMISKVFRKHSRINDVIGRVGPDELGMILPHTGQKGAAVKAERLRRIVESADFKKVLRLAPKLSVTIGLSEYPSLCRDVDELVQTADEALYEACEQGGNLVCVTERPEGFAADFPVIERGKP